MEETATTTTTTIDSTTDTTSIAAGKYVVAVGPKMCGKTTFLHDRLGAKALEHAMTLCTTTAATKSTEKGDKNNVFGVEQIDKMMKDKNCTALIIETPLTDSDTRDAVSQLVRTHRFTEKSIFHEIESVFEVPRRLRKHADIVAVFRTSNEDDRRRLYRHFAASFYDDQAQFDAALDELADYECLLLEKGEKARVYKADLAAQQAKPGSSWFWSWFGY